MMIYNNKTYRIEGRNVVKSKNSLPKSLTLYVNKENPEIYKQPTPSYIFILLGIIGIIFVLSRIKYCLQLKS